MTALIHALFVYGLCLVDKDAPLNAERNGANDGGGELIFVGYAPIIELSTDRVAKPVTREAKPPDKTPIADSGNDSEGAGPAVAQPSGEAADVPSSDVSDSSNDLEPQYLSAVREAIAHYWTQQTGKHLPAGCTLLIHQIAGGQVVSVYARGCDLDRSEQLQLEASVLMAQPLPYVGFENVFVRSLSLEL